MLTVPAKFLFRLREQVDWSDLQYAYAHQLIDGQTLIDFACHVLSKGNYDNDAVLALASASKSDELMPLIDRIAGTIADSAPLNRVRKWALILAAFISESEMTNKLEAIENVYSSFDYPEQLAEFIRYMPMKGPDLGSRKANENRMLRSLEEFSRQVVVPEQKG